jgi:hypothetical protein
MVSTEINKDFVCITRIEFYMYDAYLNLYVLCILNFICMMYIEFYVYDVY